MENVTRPTLKEPINLYLRSRNAYSAARDLLLLPHGKTIKRYFGQLGSPESISECFAIVENVFRKLIGIERWCKLMKSISSPVYSIKGDI